MSNVNREYSLAIFTVGLENGTLDDIDKDFDYVSEVFNETPGYISLLLSPNIPKSERLASLREAFTGKVCTDTLSFLSLLTENKRVDSFDAIVDEFDKLYRESRQVLIARVKSAIALTDEQKAKLKANLIKQKGREVILECSVDETLLGGIVVEFDDSKIDGSIKTRLQTLKEVMNR